MNLNLEKSTRPAQSSIQVLKVMSNLGRAGTRILSDEAQRHYSSRRYICQGAVSELCLHALLFTHLLLWGGMTWWFSVWLTDCPTRSLPGCLMAFWLTGCLTGWLTSAPRLNSRESILLSSSALCSMTDGLAAYMWAPVRAPGWVRVLVYDLS